MGRERRRSERKIVDFARMMRKSWQKIKRNMARHLTLRHNWLGDNKGRPTRKKEARMKSSLRNLLGRYRNQLEGDLLHLILFLAWTRSKSNHFTHRLKLTVMSDTCSLLPDNMSLYTRQAPPSLLDDYTSMAMPLYLSNCLL
jgi:hypothetical protein